MMMIVGSKEFRSGTHVDDQKQKAGDGRRDTPVRCDPVAFIRLYRKNYDAVFRYCVHRLFDRAAAEDVTSEVFLKVVENFGHFKGDEQRFRSWLYRIATNAVNQHLRKTARRNGLLKIACARASEPGTDCEESEAKLTLLKEAMLALKPRYQTIITLRFFETLKLTQIAEVLACSPGTVRSQLARALAKLRKDLGPEFAEGSEVIEDG